MDPIRYQSDLAGVTARHLAGGFFEGWAEPRTPAELVGFYESFGMSPGRGMWLRPHLERLRAREAVGD